jgi:uncharacterized ferritin-like protein (DUF455 family)
LEVAELVPAIPDPPVIQDPVQVPDRVLVQVLVAISHLLPHINLPHLDLHIDLLFIHRLRPLPVLLIDPLVDMELL